MSVLPLMLHSSGLHRALAQGCLVWILCFLQHQGQAELHGQLQDEKHCPIAQMWVHFAHSPFACPLLLQLNCLPLHCLLRLLHALHGMKKALRRWLALLLQTAQKRAAPA